MASNAFFPAILQLRYQRGNSTFNFESFFTCLMCVPAPPYCEVGRPEEIQECQSDCKSKSKSKSKSESNTRTRIVDCRVDSDCSEGFACMDTLYMDGSVKNVCCIKNSTY